MILDETITITIRNDMKKLYIDLGYDIPNTRNPKIKVKIKDLQKGSTQKINVKCDVCGKEKIIPYWVHRSSIEKYGYYSCQGICSRNKNKETCLEKYGDKNYNNRIKNKETCLKKYNVENPQQYEKTKEKTIKTNIERYGCQCSLGNKNVINKSKETKLEKYGDINYNNPLKNKQTCLEKYGVEHHQQNEKMFNKQQRSAFKMKMFEETDLHYQGSYELDFLNNYKHLNIENGPTIKYKYKNKNKIYYPDFYLPDYNLIVEIKSDYTYNYNLQRNILKQKACLELGYNYIFIINKDYNEFEKMTQLFF